MSGLAVILIVLGAACALVLLKFQFEAHDSLDRTESRIDSLLPQTQCRQCGYPGCRPYARAIVRDNAPIDRCPPGGRSTATAISQMLGRGQLHFGDFKGAGEHAEVKAVIDESQCIGCTKCLPACPVDAIIGAHKQMHTVIEHACTGCALCIAPCPVDCIHMVDNAAEADQWRWQHPHERQSVAGT